MDISEVRGIREAVRNMQYHYTFSSERPIYRVFYNITENEVDFTVASWGEEELSENIITLIVYPEPVTATAIMKALKARENLIDSRNGDETMRRKYVCFSKHGNFIFNSVGNKHDARMAYSYNA